MVNSPHTQDQVKEARMPNEQLTLTVLHVNPLDHSYIFRGNLDACRELLFLNSIIDSDIDVIMSQIDFWKFENGSISFIPKSDEYVIQLHNVPDLRIGGIQLMKAK